MSRSRCGKRFGLTLLELVVVLGILAMLSSMAVRSLEPLADQARFESTQRLLNDLRECIAGSSASTTNTRTPAGFFVDTGMLPASSNDLLSKDNSLVAYSVQTFDSDRDTTDDVTLSSGWNGPYLQRGAGITQIVDGWGRNPIFTPAGNGLTLSSRGSDGDSIGAEDGYRADLQTALLERDIYGDVVCRLFAIDSLNGLRIDPSVTGSEQLGVLFYGVNANGGSSGAIQEQLLPVAASGSFEVRRADCGIGKAAVRAILWNDLDNDDALDVGETIVKKSYVHYLQIQPGVDNRVEMELR